MTMVFKRVHHPNLEDVLGSTLKNNQGWENQSQSCVLKFLRYVCKIFKYSSIYWDVTGRTCKNIKLSSDHNTCSRSPLTGTDR